MTTGFVADASLGVAWVMASQADDKTERLRDAAMDGVPIVVPQLWPFEVSNALLMLTRRGKLTKSSYVFALQQTALVGLVVDDEAFRQALTEIPRLAEKHSLSIYDTIYLELALRRELPLASRDAALNKAAKKCGVKTLL